MITDITKNGDSPIWGDAIGIVIGCILGIIVPKAILGNNSDTTGLNKVTPKAAFLGDMNEMDIRLLLDYDLSILDFRALTVFKYIDVDNSETIDLDEIKT